ncbi:Predicted acetyltransferase [Alteribacillus persepolensis]|uniref:Predicted acetyltransferase n=1 Tax=Alteribacillus persepolensis TaxID=568899 RepID=A0A1G7YBA7_9BACI|nr:GNAT family N-acetyltransferase [Alteribacillus persepolensis]SDG93626.1 Predicted acetyltransferase [Alteribacillus persepolensis]
MEIRPLRESEIEQSLELNAFAFQYELNDKVREKHKQLMKNVHTWVAADKDTLLAKLHLLPSEVFVGGEKMKMGGVTWVATWPEARRHGLIRELIDVSLEEMNKQEYTLSFLYPFSIGFYRKFGWELFADTISWKLTNAQLPKKSGIMRGSFARACIDDWHVLNAVYQEAASSYNGMVVRDEWWWRHVHRKTNNAQIVIYQNEQGRETGYLIYSVASRKMTVHEYIALDEITREEIWKFIANHDSMIDELEVKPPVDDPSRFLLPDPKIEESRKSYFMARIVNVQRFFEQYPFSLEEGQSIVLTIYDDQCSWNCGTFHISAGKGQNNVEFIQNSKRALTMDVKTAAAVFLGYLSAEQAQRTGQITGEAEEAEVFQQAVTSSAPFIYDFF